MRWVLVLLLVASCYDVPRPVCGFRCGPSAACPADYACAADGFCHALGSSPTQSCPLVDAGVDAFDFWPWILEMAPPDDATGISVDTNVTVRFTEKVVGISGTTFTLSLDGQSIPAAVAYDVPSRTATLDPDAPLLSSKQYVVTLGDGIEDARGNPIYGRRSWSFKTAHDTTGPMVVMIEPADGATNVPVDGVVIVTFSEQVSHTNVGVGISAPGATHGGALTYYSQTAVKYTPAPHFAPNTLYTVTLGAAITDLTGNPLVDAPVTSQFTTGPDTIPPVIVQQVPAPDDTEVPIATPVIVYFSEPVLGASASTITLEDASGPVATAFEYSETGGNVRARLTPSAPLAATTGYTIKVAAGITDASANALAPATWSFTTGVE